MGHTPKWHAILFHSHPLYIGVVIVGNLQAWTIGLISLCAILFALSTIIIAVVAIVKVMMFRAKSFDSESLIGTCCPHTCNIWFNTQP